MRAPAPPREGPEPPSVWQRHRRVRPGGLPRQPLPDAPRRQHGASAQRHRAAGLAGRHGRAVGTPAVPGAASPLLHQSVYLHIAYYVIVSVTVSAVISIPLSAGCRWIPRCRRSRPPSRPARPARPRCRGRGSRPRWSSARPSGRTACATARAASFTPSRSPTRRTTNWCVADAGAGESGLKAGTQPQKGRERAPNLPTLHRRSARRPTARPLQ